MTDKAKSNKEFRPCDITDLAMSVELSPELSRKMREAPATSDDWRYEQMLRAAELIEEVQHTLEIHAESCLGCGQVHYKPKPAWDLSLDMTRITTKIRSMAKSQLLAALPGREAEEDG